MCEVMSINIGRAASSPAIVRFFEWMSQMKWQLVFSTRIIITQHSSTPSAARKAPHKTS